MNFFARNKNIIGVLFSIGISGYGYLHAAQEAVSALEQEASKEETEKGAEEKKVSKKRIQLLTVFLDDTEALPDNKEFVVTLDLVAAIFEKAGPILTTGSLLYNVIDGPFARSEKGSRENVIAQKFKNFFHEGDWIIRRNPYGLVVMVPKSYLQEQKIVIGDIGLHMLPNILTAAKVSATQKRISPSQWIRVQYAFVKALLNDLIFDKNNRTIEWVIYVSGHGMYGMRIVGMELTDFTRVLDYLNRYIDVGLLIYYSCYAAGFNAAQIYGELKKAARPKEYFSTGEPRFSSEYLASSEKEYGFPIVTSAITDTEVYSLPVFLNDEGSLEVRAHYKQFIKEFIDFKRAMAGFEQVGFNSAYKAMMVQWYNNIYGTLLALIMANMGYAGNLPQIRYAHSPAWFPVALPFSAYQEKTAVVRINDTMALTRTNSVVIGSYWHGKQLAAVLLDTDYIPFEIVLTERKIGSKEHVQQPYMVIMLSGDAEVYCEKITTQRTSRITEFPADMGFDFFTAKPFYAGNKRIYIKELVLDTKDMPTEIYTNGVIDFAQERFYYTDAQGKQFVVYKDENGMVEPHEYFDNYEVLYPDPLLTNKSIMDKAVKRREIQKLGFIEAAKRKRELQVDMYYE